MNQKELGELRRRFRPDKNAIEHIYGCYVGNGKDIISELDAPLSIMPPEEVEKYLNLLKKSLSGTLGKNLIDIVFSTQQVMDSDEHRLLSALRNCKLEDAEVRKAFYEKVIESLNMGDSNYLILLAHDTYDVPYRGKDGEDFADASDEVFSYIVCGICPIRDPKPELGYFTTEKEFHICSTGHYVSPPDLGFLFPAFDDRSANIYNALFYSRKANELHPEFLDAIFHTGEPPMSAGAQREAFEHALTTALEEECCMEVVQAVHEQLREKLEEHKESKDPEPLALTPRQVGELLENCGVDQARVNAFQEQCVEQFGEGTALTPANLIDAKRFEVKTPEATISVDPIHSFLVETRVIDGRTYILIPAGEGVEVNGLPIGLPAGQTTAQE